MDVQRACANARRAFRLERRDERGTTLWMVVDKRTGGGNGVRGDENAGRNHLEVRVMFRALASIDRKHDWHSYDWGLLTGPAESRVHELMRQRAEIADARSKIDPFMRLAQAMCEARP